MKPAVSEDRPSKFEVTPIIVIIVGGRRVNAAIDPNLITGEAIIGCEGAVLASRNFSQGPGPQVLFSQGLVVTT